MSTESYIIGSIAVAGSDRLFFENDLDISFIYLHCKFRRSVSDPKCQISPEAPGADAAHCGAISVTAGTKLPPLKAETAHSGTQFGPLVPVQPL